MKGRQIAYSDDELTWIERHKMVPRKGCWAAFRVAFERPDVTFDQFKALCTRKGWKTGRDGRIQKGNVPVNKGKPCQPGKGGRSPNAQAHHFRKGGLPHNTKFLGHERLSKDGYWEISVDQVNPHTGFNRRYVLKHKWLWEQVNGPVPAGHALKCLDGDRQNTDPSNWQVVPRQLLPRLAGRWTLPYDKAEPETRPALMAVAQLAQASKRARHA